MSPRPASCHFTHFFCPSLVLRSFASPSHSMSFLCCPLTSSGGLITTPINHSSCLAWAVARGLVLPGSILGSAPRAYVSTASIYEPVKRSTECGNRCHFLRAGYVQLSFFPVNVPFGLSPWPSSTSLLGSISSNSISSHLPLSSHLTHVPSAGFLQYFVSYHCMGLPELSLTCVHPCLVDLGNLCLRSSTSDCLGQCLTSAGDNMRPGKIRCILVHGEESPFNMWMWQGEK